MLIVVDDDEGIRVLLEEVLLDRGYDVITAQNGSEGLDWMFGVPIDEGTSHVGRGHAIIAWALGGDMARAQLIGFSLVIVV